MRILIVEDDVDIAQSLQETLRQEGYAADIAGNLAQAWGVLTSEPVDAVLLDLGLPDGDGLTLLARVRSLRPGQVVRPEHDLPMLIMTARDAVPDRVVGLDGGADDYLVKPFDVQELLARLRLALRRTSGRASPLIEHGKLSVNPASREVLLAGRPVNLGVREYSLLVAMLQAKGVVLDRARLEAAVYGFGEELESNAIEVHVHHLRRKLGEGLIRTVRGVGYFIARETPP